MNILDLPLDTIGAVTAVVFTAIYTTRNTKKKLDNASKESEKRTEESEKRAEESAKRAYQDAIEAMQVHLSVLRLRLQDAENEIVRLRKIMEEKGVSI